MTLLVRTLTLVPTVAMRVLSCRGGAGFGTEPSSRRSSTAYCRGFPGGRVSFHLRALYFLRMARVRSSGNSW